MNKTSHVDVNKINKLPNGRSFEYKDIVNDNFPINEHDEDGKIFKSEVEHGVYGNIEVQNDSAHTTVKYKKI